MKNAHLHFGHLIYGKVLKKTTTRFKVPLDRFIAEPETNSVAKAYLISVIGGHTQIADLAAANNVLLPSKRQGRLPFASPWAPRHNSFVDRFASKNTSVPFATWSRSQKN